VRALIAVGLALVVVATIPPLGIAGAEPSCCAFASGLAAEIDEYRDAMAATDSALGKALDKAVESLRNGIKSGAGACDTRAAEQKFQNARTWLLSAAVAANDTGKPDGDVVRFIAELDGLLAGVCEDGPALPLE
jgi:hypothetical protein